MAAEQIGIADSIQQIETIAKIRTVLETRCSSRERLIFYLRFPNLPLRACDVGMVETRQGLPIDVAGLPVFEIDGRVSRIAAVLGLTSERARQIATATLLKLRARLE